MNLAIPHEPFYRAAPIASVIAIAGGFSVMLGWTFDVAVLKSVLPGLVTMKVNTALSFMLAGISLWLRKYPRPATRVSFIAAGCSLLVVLIGALTLIEIAFRFDFGIDQFLISTPADFHKTSSPGRMAPNTALGFILIGTALAILDAHAYWIRQLSQCLALLVLLIAFLAAAGYAFSASALIGVNGFTSMALNTTAGFAVLSIGVVAVRPDRGIAAILAQNNSAGHSARRLLPAIVVALFTIAWLRLKGQQAGWYGTEFGLALMVTVSCGVIVAVVLWHSFVQGNAFQAERVRIRDEQFVFQLGELLRGSIDQDEMLFQVSKAVGEYLGISRCLFNEIDIANDRWVVRRDYFSTLSSLAGTQPLSTYSPASLADGHAGRTVISDDTRIDKRTAYLYETTYRPLGLRARAAIPLLRNGKWVATLLASHHEPRNWESREISLLQLVAERTWLWLEHLQAQDTLRMSERKFRELYENHPDMCATVDFKTETIMECNATLANQLGYLKDEVIGLCLDDIYHAGAIGQRDSARAEIERSGVLSDVERILRRKDGSTLEVAVNVIATKGTDGRLYGKGVWRNISARKQAERDRKFMIELSELPRISSNPSDLLFMVSKQLAVYLNVDRAFFSEVATEQNQLTIDSYYFRDSPTINSAANLAAYAAKNCAAMQMGKTIVMNDTHSDTMMTTRIDVADNYTNVSSIISAPIMREGRWVASLSVADSKVRTWGNREVELVQSIAERAWLWIEHLRLSLKLLETERRELSQRSEARFRILVEGVKEYAIYLLDSNGCVASWNAGAQRLQGYDESEIIGKHFSLFYLANATEQQRSYEALRRAARDGSYEEEGWRLRKDGSTFWASSILTPVFDAHGALEGFAKVTRDFSERRRTDEILQQRQIQIEMALKEKEVLLQEVHHRVTNNLQVISSLINIQKRQVADTAARNALDECKTRIEVIARIHAKLYQSKDYANVSFSEYAAGLIASIFHATGISPSNIALEVQVETVSLAVDKAIPCGLILNELITNALKHAFPAGRQGIVRVELRKEDALILFTVSDNGIGMREDFDPQTARSIGMQLIYTLVEQLNGKIEIARCNGTTIIIAVPLEVSP